MRTLLAAAACALLMSPVFAQDEGGGDEAKTEDSGGEISAPAPAPRRTGGPAYAAPGRRPSVNPVSSPSGGGGAAPNSEGASDAPAGISQGSGDRPQKEVVRDQGTTPAAAASAGDSSFQEIDIGLLPTIQSVTGQASGGGRPVIFLGGGKKWAIRMRHKGPGKGAFPMMIGGTNGALTGGGKYTFKAAISAKKGDLGGSCVGEMVNGAYVTCQQPCTMQWELRFGYGKAAGTCALDNDKVYFLNVAPVGPGCKGGQAEANGCPIVMEAANGGTIELSEHRK